MRKGEERAAEIPIGENNRDQKMQVETGNSPSTYASLVFVFGLMAVCGLGYLGLSAILPGEHHLLLALLSILGFAAVMILWPGQYRIIAWIDHHFLPHRSPTSKS